MGYTMNKVLHIITGLNDGGAEGVLTRICLLEPHNHTVISLMDKGKYGDILEKAGVNVFYINMNPSRFKLRNIYDLYHTIKKIKPSHVQTWMYHADLLGGITAKAAGISNVYWGIRHSNLDKDTIKKSTFMVTKLCAYLSYIVPKKIISCSNQAVLSHVKQGYSQKKFTVVQNGYDLTKFKPMPNFKSPFAFSENDKPLVAMVARYDIQKDHENLIQALSIVKDKLVDFHLVLVGTGMTADNDELLEIINRSSLTIEDDVTLLGQCNDIPSLFNAIDLHILSSLGEAFPNVLAEAMACGIPCVSTDVGDAKEIVGQQGWVVPAQNSKALADAIMSALNERTSDPQKWQSRKLDGIEHISSNFEVHNMVNSFHKIWNAI